MSTEKKKVVIIGGGITGLSAAFYLQKEIVKKQLSIEITLVESSPRLGGKIQTIHHDGYMIERGPDSFLERKTSAPQLVKDVGLGDQLVNNAIGRSYVLVKDQLHPIPAGAVMGIPTKMSPFISTGLFSLPGKMRAAADFVLPSNKVIGDQSLGQFFRRRLGDEVVENLIEPLLSGIYAGDIDKLSLMSTFPQFYKVEQEHRSLILGMRKTIPSTVGKHTPSKGIFQTVKGGLQSLVDAIESQMDQTTIVKGCKVDGIHKLENQYELLLNNGNVQMADAVVITTPHFTVPQMIQDPEFAYFKEMPATSVANVAMAFPEEAVKMDKEGTGFVISRNEDYTITACTWTHKKWPHTTPKGKVLLRAYVGKAGHEAIVEQPDEEIIQTVLHDLKQKMEITSTPEFSYVTRWKQSMPQYNVGHIEKIKSIKKNLDTKYPGLYLAGSSYEGIGIPDCIDQGKKAVQEVLNYIDG